MDQIPTGQLHRLSQIQTTPPKRNNQVDFTGYYHLITQYVANLTANAKLDDTQKQDRMKELGLKIGSNVMEIIAAVAFDKIKLDNRPDSQTGRYTEYIKFLGRDFWTYLFGQKVSKVSSSKKGNFYELEDRFEERAGTTPGIMNIFPGFQMTRRSSIGDSKYNFSTQPTRLIERYLQLWAKLIQGLVLGGMRTLGVDCEVEAQFVANQVLKIKKSVGFRLEVQHQYSRLLKPHSVAFLIAVLKRKHVRQIDSTKTK